MFYNLSNHPSDRWGDSQKQAAYLYGDIVDIPFPQVPASASEEDIQVIVNSLIDNELSEVSSEDAIMVQGEYTLTFSVVSRLLKKNLTVLTACSERVAKVWTDKSGVTKRESEFRFVRFRKYIKGE